MSTLTYQMDVSSERRGGLTRLSAYCDALEQDADFKTGSISLASMAYLRMLMERYHPAIVIEVGTFIGKSTLTMLDEPSVEHLYTCDMHNDCLSNTTRLTCHPMKTSTSMLGGLVDNGVKADAFFFDGRLSPSDVPLILRLSKWNTVYIFDDYHEEPPGCQFTHGKGVFNIALLEPFLSEHTFVGPPERVGDLDGFTTIAMLVPKELV